MIEVKIHQSKRRVLNPAGYFAHILCITRRFLSSVLPRSSGHLSRLPFPLVSNQVFRIYSTNSNASTGFGISPSWVNLTFLSGIARGSRPLPGFGVSPNKLLFSFFSPPVAAREETRNLGTPQTPAGRTLHPFSDGKEGNSARWS